MKILSLIMSLVTIFLVSIFFSHRELESCVLPSSQGDWKIEIVRTPKEQARGLMFSKNLCDRCGMLFVFSDEQPRVFWMKNTLIPLDIYFYDARGELVDTAYNMRPEDETPSPMIYQSKPAKYVVEVKNGSSFSEQFISCI